MKKTSSLFLSFIFTLSLLAQTPCDSTVLISIDLQNTTEVIYSVSGANVNIGANFSWVYFSMGGMCIGGSLYNSPSDTVRLNNNLPDSTRLWCTITDSTGSCVVIDTLVYDSLSGWTITSNPCSNSTITIDTSACQGLLYNGVYYSSSGTHLLYKQPLNQCDTIFTFLNIDLAGKHTSSYDTIVAENSYDWNGQTITSTGDYNQTINNAQGCDSLMYLNLTIFTPTEVLYITKEKELVKTINLLGREKNQKKNTPFIEIYNDGTVEKKIIIE